MDRLVVLMGNRVAGTLRLRANNLLTFEYDEDYRHRTNATPISLSMPLAVRTHADTTAHPVVSNYLQGLLPDDDALLKRWASFYQTRTTNPFYLLGTPVGRDCAGAVSFCPEEELTEYLGRGGRVDPLSIDDVAGILRDLHRDRTLVLGANFEGEFSLAGAQTKVALVHDLRGWGRPHGTAATNRILKPSALGWTDHDVNEHLCLAAAAAADLTVAHSVVMTFADQESIVSHRYDRTPGPDGFYRRVHQEDLCQALGISPDRKYENQGGPSPKEIAALLRRAMPGSDAERAVRAFADSLAYNWIIAGTDNHAKNYSLLLAGNDVRLAPLYDISSILPYIGTRSPLTDEIIDPRRTRSAMKIGGHYEYEPLHNSWPKAATELGIPQDEMSARVLALTERVPEAFVKVAASLSSSLNRPLVNDLVDRVLARSERCRSVLV